MLVLDGAVVALLLGQAETQVVVDQDGDLVELRHTFVGLMSDSDVAVEEIARLVGHAAAKSPKPSTGISSGPS